MGSHVILQASFYKHLNPSGSFCNSLRLQIIFVSKTGTPSSQTKGNPNHFVLVLQMVQLHDYIYPVHKLLPFRNL